MTMTNTTTSTKTRTVRLEATTARDARREISARWPHFEVPYKGYSEDGECVLMSLVRRRGDKAPVASASRNRTKRSVSFDAEVPV